MRYLVGTSGYAYREWLGKFYPPKLPAGEMLDFYAKHFASVEINNTKHEETGTGPKFAARFLELCGR